MSGMERYIHLRNDYYYDCLRNKILQSSKLISQTIKSNNCKFPYLFDDNFLESNIMSNRHQLILSVTEQCNLRCEYCAYYDNRYDSHTPISHMSFETAKLAIDDYISHSYLAEKRCISFYGGEPLLNFELIKKCVAYVESLNLGKSMQFLFTTNGTTLTEEIAEYAYNKRFLVNISIDGPEFIHDRYRKDIGESGTFSKIVKAAKFLIDLDPIYWKDAIHFFGVLAPPVDMKSTLDFLEVAPFNYSVTDMIFTNHMKKYLEEHIKHSPHYSEHVEIIFKSYFRQHSAIADETRKVRKILQRNIVGTHFFAPGAYCVPMVRRLFVSAAGDYYLCEKYDQDISCSFGDVHNGVDIEKLTSLRKKVLDFHSRNCKQCWAVRFCGICFATIDRYPDCCEGFKKAALDKLIYTLEDDYEQQRNRKM